MALQGFEADRESLALPDLLADVPWSLVMALASLALIYYLFRRRADVFADFAFSGKEVALLALGSIAGGAVNIPLAIFGGTYLAVNVGGTLVPIILIAWWIRQKKLRIVPALVGTALVAFTAWKIVQFRPDVGIVAKYPTFFLPVVVALAFAILVSIRKPITGVPVAYASGTMGALIGADVMNIDDIGAHFANAHDNTVISIGGAGVFDMVFLAGTFAMALHIALVVLLHKPRVGATDIVYPATPLSLRDSRRVHDSFRKLDSPNALERAIEGIALSNLALREGDYTKSVRMAWLAVDSALAAGPVELPTAARDDMKRLQEQYQTTRARDATLAEAGNANLAAKHLVAALAQRNKMRHGLEGIA